MCFRLPLIWLMATVRSPSSSWLSIFRSCLVKSPAAMAWACARTARLAPAMPRLRKTATKTPTPMATNVAPNMVSIIARVSALTFSLFSCSKLLAESTSPPSSFLIPSLAAVACSVNSFPALATASRSLTAASVIADSWAPRSAGSSFSISSRRSRLACRVKWVFSSSSLAASLPTSSHAELNEACAASRRSCWFPARMTCRPSFCV